MSDENPKDCLLKGVRILDPVLTPLGFEFHLESAGKGSGGYFASATYRKDDRTLELHFRESLGLVTYHIGSAALDHETYMRLLGVYGENQYPDFPSDPLESFKHLAADLQSYCSDFLSGDGEEFVRLAAEFEKNAAMFKGVP
jgi:hypothetical protein